MGSAMFPYVNIQEYDENRYCPEIPAGYEHGWRQKLPIQMSSYHDSKPPTPLGSRWHTLTIRQLPGTDAKNPREEAPPGHCITAAMQVEKPWLLTTRAVMASQGNRRRKRRLGRSKAAVPKAAARSRKKPNLERRPNSIAIPSARGND
ncbi:hypothetical protein FDECE_3173 [Fusarium decemcellulare]|nr:hypothetical protein FDECE_3173 [Fusarium decemcellulare]